jgi:hypothetical protein
MALRNLSCLDRESHSCALSQVALAVIAGAALSSTASAAVSFMTAAVTATLPSAVGPPPSIESVPIQCWWKTNKAAVHVGERLVLTLTCGVIETGRVTVVPNMEQLDPSALQVAPFEVLAGVRHEDVKAGLWRYLQYDYTLRLIEDNFSHPDIDIPSLNITYNVEMTAGATAQQGRDHTYTLPTLPIRIISLVPRNAAGIRDAPRETFADIEAREFRARGELVAAAILFGVAALLFAMGVGKLTARIRVRRPVATRNLTTAVLMRACVRELARLAAQPGSARDTEEFVGRALAVFRIAGAVALSQPVAQVEAPAGSVPHDGQLRLRRSWLGSKGVLISAPVTERTLSSRLDARSRRPLGADSQAVIEGIRQALETFSAASYTRDAALDPAALDEALLLGMTAVRRLRLFTLWPPWISRTFLKRYTPLEDMAWSS